MAKGFDCEQCPTRRQCEPIDVHKLHVRLQLEPVLWQRSYDLPTRYFVTRANVFFDELIALFGNSLSTPNYSQELYGSTRALYFLCISCPASVL